MDESGRIIERKKIPTQVKDLTRFFSKYKESRPVVEACPV
jgi:hypothetical protein